MKKSEILLMNLKNFILYANRETIIDEDTESELLEFANWYVSRLDRLEKQKNKK